MQRRQRTPGLLGTAAAAVLLAMTLGLAGCGSDGDDGAQGPPGPEGPPGPGLEPTEPLAGVKLHMQLFGATMDGTGSHAGLVGEVTACSACHAGPGSAVPFSTAHAQPVSAITPASIDSVSVLQNNPTTIEIEFTVEGYNANTIDVELTLAKWLPERGTWISMLQRDVAEDVGARVIRAANLRLQGDTAVTGDGSDTYTTMIRSPNPAQYGPGSDVAIDFSNGLVWRTAGESDASTYCGDDPAYCAFVQEIIDDINAAAPVWDNDAIYRVGVTSRNIGASRFNTIGYFDGNGLLMADEPNPNPVMTQASCNSCHGERVLLNVHGNQRHEPELCSSCHNDFTYDATNSTAEPGGWTNIGAALMVHKIHAGIEGYMVVDRDYSDLRYPDWLFGRNVGPQNCTTCHKDDGPVADAKWNVVSNEACLTCHVGDTLTDAGFNPPHGNFVGSPASFCAGCHGQGAPSADEFHGVTAALAVLAERKDYRLNIVSVTDAVAGAEPKVTWEVLDANEQIRPSVSDLNPQQLLVGIGWGYGDDWVNDGVELRDNGARGDPWRIEVTADNTVFDGNKATTTLPALPDAATAGRNGFAAIYLIEDDNAGLNVNGKVIKPNTAVATLTLGTPVTNPGNERREIVGAEGCNSCHTTTFRHGTIADADITGCVACHNGGSLSRDASEVQGSVDFMFMVHAIHSIGDGKRVRFDRRRDHGYTDRSQVNTSLACTSCHEGLSYRSPDSNKRIGVIADGDKAAFLAGTGVNSPEGSVCLSCHEVGE